MAHGGARPGAGRPKGGTNKITAEAIARAEEGGELPLDFLLRIMRDAEADEAKRIDCAKAAAPYIHAKLASIEHSTDEQTAHTLAGLGRLGWQTPQ